MKWAIFVIDASLSDSRSSRVLISSGGVTRDSGRHVRSPQTLPVHGAWKIKSQSLAGEPLDKDSWILSAKKPSISDLNQQDSQNSSRPTEIPGHSPTVQSAQKHPDRRKKLNQIPTKNPGREYVSLNRGSPEHSLPIGRAEGVTSSTRNKLQQEKQKDTESFRLEQSLASREPKHLFHSQRQADQERNVPQRQHFTEEARANLGSSVVSGQPSNIIDAEVLENHFPWLFLDNHPRVKKSTLLSILQNEESASTNERLRLIAKAETRDEDGPQDRSPQTNLGGTRTILKELEDAELIIVNNSTSPQYIILNPLMDFLNQFESGNANEGGLDWQKETPRNSGEGGLDRQNETPRSSAQSQRQTSFNFADYLDQQQPPSNSEMPKQQTSSNLELESSQRLTIAGLASFLGQAPSGSGASSGQVASSPLQSNQQFQSERQTSAESLRSPTRQLSSGPVSFTASDLARILENPGLVHLTQEEVEEALRGHEFLREILGLLDNDIQEKRVVLLRENLEEKIALSQASKLNKESLLLTNLGIGLHKQGQVLNQLNQPARPDNQPQAANRKSAKTNQKIRRLLQERAELQSMMNQLMAALQTEQQYSTLRELLKHQQNRLQSN